ncbi:hypothetical protein Bca101_010225 [Brassica carinata]
MRRSILSRVNPCYPNNGSGSIAGPYQTASAPAIQSQGRISVVASPVTSRFEEDKSYRLRVSEGYMSELPGSERVNPTTSMFQELGDILNGSAKGYEGNLDLGPHPVAIESGSPQGDSVRCRLKSIQLLGLRQRNKGSPPGKKMEFS